MALTKVGNEGITGISNASDATAITITSAENVGIGETVPLARLHVKEGDSGVTSISSNFDQLVLEDDLHSGMHILSGTGSDGAIYFGDSGNSSAGQLKYFHGSDAMAMMTGDTERLRIDSSGNVGIGTTSPSAKLHVVQGDAALLFTNTFTNVGHTACHFSNSEGSGAYRIRFDSNDTVVGSIGVGTSSTAYNTSSDYRLKENVIYDWDATTRLKQLKPARFNFIIDADKTVDGFLAHEAQAIVPESVTGTKDEVDEDGVAVMQSIDNSKLVPLLVKTIQELEARLTAGGL
jgi:hypothetical protein